MLKTSKLLIWCSKQVKVVQNSKSCQHDVRMGDVLATPGWVELYTLFQNGRHLDILLFFFKLDLDASFKAKYSFEFSAQERGIKG